MKILVVSDSHGNNEALDLLAKIYPNMDFYLHLGDSESDEGSIRPFISVMGNMDDYPYFNNFLTIPTPMGNIYALHTPYVSKRELELNKARFFLHGHTHRRRLETIDKITYINPGSISYSRDGNELSYLILDINEKEFDAKFYTIDAKNVQN